MQGQLGRSAMKEVEEMKMEGEMRWTKMILSLIIVIDWRVKEGKAVILLDCVLSAYIP